MFHSVLEALHYPIWQAPTASIAGPELAAAVSKAGGMGSMALTWTNPEIAAEQVSQVRSQTENPFFVNFALAFPPLALDAALEAGAPIVTFSWGDPEPYLPQVRAAGAQVGIQVTNVAGAHRAIAQGADFLICQGVEAGGHVQSNTSLWELLPRIVEAASGVPVIAAGGIARGKEIAKVLALGATGALLGTRFVATQESRAHRDYKRQLVAATGETALTVCFDGGWPYSAHRVLRNSTLEAWEAAGSPAVGSRPGEGETVATTANGEAILRYEDTVPRAGYTGNIEAMCLYAGTGCSAIADIPSAGALVERLWRECGEEAFEDGGTGRGGGA
ncbi:MAG TPA: nitronate monooxygenase [Chthonomonadaceae bacterium]|nr:nitronate monooxygenase [Chthonomonadaceae bacterium]